MEQKKLPAVIGLDLALETRMLRINCSLPKDMLPWCLVQTTLNFPASIIQFKMQEKVVESRITNAFDLTTCELLANYK